MYDTLQLVLHAVLDGGGRTLDIEERHHIERQVAVVLERAHQLQDHRTGVHLRVVGAEAHLLGIEVDLHDIILVFVEGGQLLDGLYGIAVFGLVAGDEQRLRHQQVDGSLLYREDGLLAGK